MNIETCLPLKVTPAQLSKCLANATPNDFAEFWFRFNDDCSKENLDMFAKAMAREIGANRKKPLIELVNLMQYHEMKSKKNES